MKRFNRSLGVLFFINILLFNILNAENTGYFWSIIDPEFDSIAALIEKGDPDAPIMEIRLQRLEDLSRERNNPILLARYRYWNANRHGNEWNATQNSEAKERYLQETLINIDKTNYDYDYARILFLMLGPRGNTPDNYLEQYRQLNMLAAIFQHHGDHTYEANCYRYLGILFSELHEYEQAVEYLDKADEKYAYGKNLKAVTSNKANKAIVFHYMGRSDTAERMLKDLLSNAFIRKDTNTIVTLYNNLSLVAGSEHERRLYQDSAVVLTQKYSGWNKNYLSALISVNLANSYVQENQLDSAILLYHDALIKAERDHSQRILLPALSGLSNCYARKNDYRNAYLYISRFKTLQDSVMGTDKISEINRKEAGMAINEYKNRLLLQEQKIALQKRQSFLTLVIIILFSIALLFVLIYFWQKKRLAETILKNKDLQNQKLQQEIDHQNRELSSNMLILSEKRKFLQQILVQFEKHRSKGDMTNPCELELRKTITEHIRSEDEWDAFKLHFEKVHPDFFGKLKAIHPDLSPNDLKLCAYIRIGLSIKQISQMTAVLPATVKTNRYLLRKKLQLDENRSLDAYIFDV